MIFGGKVYPKKYFQKFWYSQKTFLYGDDQSKSFEKLKFKKFKCPKMKLTRPKMAHGWNGPTNFVLKKNIFYKFLCWFLGEKCTLKNISINFGTHKKPFYMVMTTSKSFEKLKFNPFNVQKSTNHVKKWPIVEMVQLTLFCKKTFFINSIVDFWEKSVP